MPFPAGARPPEGRLIPQCVPVRSVSRIHEETTDHKGPDAAGAQQAQGFCQKVIVDGEIAQLREVGIVEGLLAERRIADNQVETRP